MSPTIPAGWYPDPSNPQLQRYWDGSQWTGHTAPATVGHQGAAPARPATRPAYSFNPYAPEFNLASLSEERRVEYRRHQLNEFPSWAFVVLSIITLGIFGWICHGLKHSKLPLIKDDDFTAGKAIGFSLIPLFNIYWIFPFWIRLAERINFQYALRGAPPPVSKDLVIWTNVTGIAAAFILITIVAWPVLACISGAQIQSAANRLARGEVDTQSALAQAPPPRW